MGCTSTKTVQEETTIGKQTVHNIKQVLYYGGAEHNLNLIQLVNLIDNYIRITLQQYGTTIFKLTPNERKHLTLYLALEYLKVLFIHQWNTDYKDRFKPYETYNPNINYSLPEHSLPTIIEWTYPSPRNYTNCLINEAGLVLHDDLPLYLLHVAEVFRWNIYITIWLYNVLN